MAALFLASATRLRWARGMWSITLERTSPERDCSPALLLVLLWMMVAVAAAGACTVLLMLVEGRTVLLILVEEMAEGVGMLLLRAVPAMALGLAVGVPALAGCTILVEVVAVVVVFRGFVGVVAGAAAVVSVVVVFKVLEGIAVDVSGVAAAAVVTAPVVAAPVATFVGSDGDGDAVVAVVIFAGDTSVTVAAGLFVFNRRFCLLAGTNRFRGAYRPRVGAFNRMLGVKGFTILAGCMLVNIIGCFRISSEGSS